MKKLFLEKNIKKNFFLKKHFFETKKFTSDAKKSLRLSAAPKHQCIKVVNRLQLDLGFGAKINRLF